MRISINLDTHKDEPTGLQIITDNKDMYMIYENEPMSILIDKIIAMMKERNEDDYNISLLHTALYHDLPSSFF